MLRQAARALSGAVPRLAAVTEVSAPRLRVQEALACSLQPHRGIPVRAASWGDGRAFATESSKGEGEKDEAQRAEQAEGEGTSTTDEMTLEQLKEKLGKSEQDLAEQAKQVLEAKDSVLRTLAEMENLRERTRRQAELDKKFANQAFVKDLLDVADNFARAVSTVPAEVRDKLAAGGEAPEAGKLLQSLLEGVLLTEKQLLKAFSKHGVVKLDPPVGEPFDPNAHMALFNVPPSGAATEPGTVAVVTKAGYKLHDRVIRPAEVGVVQAAQ